MCVCLLLTAVCNKLFSTLRYFLTTHRPAFLSVYIEMYIKQDESGLNELQRRRKPQHSFIFMAMISTFNYSSTDSSSIPTLIRKLSMHTGTGSVQFCSIVVNTLAVKRPIAFFHVSPLNID